MKAQGPGSHKPSGPRFHGISPWPLAALLFLCGAVLFKMLAHPFSFYTVDIFSLFPLAKYINGGAPVRLSMGITPEPFFLVLGIKALYTPVLLAFKALGAQWPFIAVSKFWGFILIPLSFWVWARYLHACYGKNMAWWGALAVTAYNVRNYVIPDGVARSFSVLLLGCWLLALRGRSFWRINALLVVTSLVYPILLPLMGLSLLFATAWSWRGQESAARRALTLFGGFVSSISYPVLRPLLNPVIPPQSPLAYAQILERSVNHLGASAWFDITRLSGRLGGQNIFQWINFNVFYSWYPVPGRMAWMLGAVILLIVLAGLACHLFKGRQIHAALYPGVLAAVTACALALFTPCGLLAAVSWWVALSGVAWFLFGPRKALHEIPREIKLLLLAAPPAFVLIFLFFTYCDLSANIPGRQLQRPFGVAGPVFAALWIKDVWGRCAGRWGRLVQACMVLAAVLLLWMIPPDLKYRYPEESVMRALKGLPQDSLILAYPKTANFIPVLAGRNTTVPAEYFRAVMEPYWTDMRLQNRGEMEVYYATGPGPVEAWCQADRDRRFILVEKDNYEPKAVKQLLWPLNQDMEKNRPQGYYLRDLAGPCRRTLSPNAFLVPCGSLPGCRE